MVSDVVEPCDADVPLALLVVVDADPDDVEPVLPAVSLAPLPAEGSVVSPSTACGGCFPPGLKSLAPPPGRDDDVTVGEGAPITGLAVGAAGANDVSAGAEPDCP